MDIFIIFIIIAAFFVVLTTTKNYIPFINKEGFTNIEKKCIDKPNSLRIDNFSNKKNTKLNCLENKQYYYKNDCIWNDKCELPPNNYNFFKYSPKKKVEINILTHKINPEIVSNNNQKFTMVNKKSCCPCKNKAMHNDSIVIKNCISPNFPILPNRKIPKICPYSYKQVKM